METFSVLLFGTYILIFTSIDGSKSQQTCPLPDFPEKGNYSSKSNEFRPGDSVIYSCEEAYNLVGKDRSKCKSDGNWSHPTPFCDRKAVLKNPYANLITGLQHRSPQVTDSNLTTCFPLKIGGSIEVSLERQTVVYAVRLYLGSGFPHPEIQLGRKRCDYIFGKYLQESSWVMFTCKNNTELSNSVVISKSGNSNFDDVCEIEVYVKEEDGCENPPPQKKILNGHFEVSRSKAKLVCAEGYRSTSNRLVCEDNEWKGENQNFFCEEILCNPQLNSIRQIGGDWKFLDPVKKISAGTKRQLKCDSGYLRTGDPDVIECQKDGTWTKTTATCVEILCNPQLNSTRSIGGDWKFLDPVKKISAGAKRQLKCDSDYLRTGHPDVIECQKDGTWTKTNATCVAKKKPEMNTQTIIYASVGVVVILIIIALLAAIIFIVKKQRERQVVVIYKSPGEGSVLSGSDGDNSAYYETMHSTSPMASPLQLHEILSDGYAVPLYGKNHYLRT